jgi:hypothetical protein
MQVIGYSWTKRLPPTELGPVFMKMTGAKSLEDLIQGYTAHYYEIGADAARTVFQVAEQGASADEKWRMMERIFYLYK